MAKKGTPEYEIWLKKFQEKKNLQTPRTESFEENTIVKKLKKKLLESLVEENDLLMFIFLSKVEANTLSLSAISVIKDRFNLDEDSFNLLSSFFKTLSKDILKLRLIGIYNFYNYNEKPESYPHTFQSKYSKENFKEKYGYDLSLISKAYSL